MNSLQKLLDFKQSYWLDFIRRDLLISGELKRLVKEDGLRGMTSNPTIFEKAISSSEEYDTALKKASGPGKTNEQIFEVLAIQDIQRAADILKPVYVTSHASDGYVSLEVNPKLAYDTKGTLAEAKRLATLVKRPNLMVKIPGTQEGLKAIEEATAMGLNINVTLLFSVENYKQVVESYLKGLERRARQGKHLHHVASVASFFVSRVDTVVDKILDQFIAAGGEKASRAEQLLHKAAIANAKLAYEYYEQIIHSERWTKLARKGAQPQRLLWASTGTKDNRLSDVIYVEELVGADTVNTMPPQTAEAFKDHGLVEPRLSRDLEPAKATLEALDNMGINLSSITDQLQKDGVNLFIKSFDDLIQVVGSKCEILTQKHDRRLNLSLGHYENSFHESMEKLERENWIERIWNKDAGLWKDDEAHQKIIRNSLGWLRVMNVVEQRLPELKKIVTDVRKAKFTHILLLGMGGSSLAPEVLRLTLGKKSGYPDLAILDSTEPASVIERAHRSKPEKTLYIVASKSGSTTEPNAFFAYFYDQVKKVRGAKAGDNFIAITDPGTSMEKTAKDFKFRHIVLNPPDIGGRYSALSFFGMLPAALMGFSVPTLIRRAQQMADACSKYTPAHQNPGAILGAALGSLANRGRDKVTFFLSKDIASFSTWAEQLVAESTGKEGVGIVPVESEAIQDPEFYGQDRVFISLVTAKHKDLAFEKKLRSLEKVGHPVIRITLPSKEDITSEFFRWEIATAIAGKILNINPFDQPNVQESKDLTKKYLEEYKATGKLPFDKMGLNIEELKKLFNNINPGDYIALSAYVTRNEENEVLLQEIRHLILRWKKVATTLGFGPRFLHSTGQLHKGGGNNGLFIQITADDAEPLSVPGESYTFSILKEAQALGDLTALKNRERRLIQIHFSNAVSGLEEFRNVLQSIGTFSPIPLVRV